MGVKENLLAAIRDYAAAARHIPSAQQTIESAQTLADEIQHLPDPVSQGAGSVPEMNNGGSGQRGNDSGGAPVININLGQGKPPSFPDKAGVVARLKGQ